MPTLHRECYHTLIMMKTRKNFPFLSRHFQALGGPINVSVDLKYDVLCL